MRLIWCAAWVSSVAGAAIIGAVLARTDAPPAERRGSREERLARSAASRCRLERNPRTAAPSGPEHASAPISLRARPTLSRALGFSAAGITDADTLSRALMSFAGAKLAGSDEDRIELVFAINDALRVLNDREGPLSALKLRRDPNAVIRAVYPWLPFLIEREAEVAGLLETTLRAMAETPDRFEGLERDTLALLTGLTAFRPAIVDDETMARFEALASAIEARGSESLEAVNRARRVLHETRRLWRPAPTPEQQIARINAGSLDEAELRDALEALGPGEIERLDVNAIGSALSAGAVFELLPAIRQLVAHDPSNRQVFDRAMLDGVLGQRISAHHLMRYAEQTGRASWSELAPFLEIGLIQGGEIASTFASALAFASGALPMEEVRVLLDRHRVGDEALRARIAEHLAGR